MLETLLNPYTINIQLKFMYSIQSKILFNFFFFDSFKLLELFPAQHQEQAEQQSVNTAVCTMPNELNDISVANGTVYAKRYRSFTKQIYKNCLFFFFITKPIFASNYECRICI